MIYIFDFDGTIADTYELYKRIGKKVMKKYKINISEEEINSLRTMKVREVRELMKKKHVGWLKFFLMIRYFKKELLRHWQEIKLFKGMPELINSLSGEVIIYTSNSKKLVENVLKKYGVRYDKIITNNVFNKAKRLKRFIKGKAVYIGDDYRDKEAADNAGIAFVHVAWGFQEVEDSKTVRNIEELKKYLKSLEK